MIGFLSQRKSPVWAIEELYRIVAGYVKDKAVSCKASKGQRFFCQFLFGFMILGPLKPLSVLQWLCSVYWRRTQNATSGVRIAVASTKNLANTQDPPPSRSIGLTISKISRARFLFSLVDKILTSDPQLRRFWEVLTPTAHPTCRTNKQTMTEKV